MHGRCQNWIHRSNADRWSLGGPSQREVAAAKAEYILLHLFALILRGEFESESVLSAILVTDGRSNRQRSRPAGKSQQQGYAHPHAERLRNSGCQSIFTDVATACVEKPRLRIRYLQHQTEIRRKARQTIAIFLDGGLALVAHLSSIS